MSEGHILEKQKFVQGFMQMYFLFSVFCFSSLFFGVVFASSPQNNNWPFHKKNVTSSPQQTLHITLTLSHTLYNCNIFIYDPL